jgi:hypothetical protein
VPIPGLLGMTAATARVAGLPIPRSAQPGPLPVDSSSASCTSNGPRKSRTNRQGHPRRLMPPHLPRGEVRMGTGADDRTVRVELPFEDDDRVRRRVQVRPPLEAGRVPDEVVLLAVTEILVEQRQADRLHERPGRVLPSRVMSAHR